MIREIRDSKITRKEIYAKYFSVLEDQDSRNMSAEFAKDIEVAEEIFDGKKKLNLLIKGNVFTIGGGMRYFTFIDEEFDIDKCGLEKALLTIDTFRRFMDSVVPEKVVEVADERDNVFFSKVEQEFVARQIVANAKIIINVE